MVIIPNLASVVPEIEFFSYITFIFILNWFHSNCVGESILKGKIIVIQLLFSIYSFSFSGSGTQLAGKL